MKFMLGVVMWAAAAAQANAATLPYGDFDVISVVPRSASVKPLIMPISVKDLNRLASKGAKATR